MACICNWLFIITYILTHYSILIPCWLSIQFVRADVNSVNTSGTKMSFQKLYSKQVGLRKVWVQRGAKKIVEGLEGMFYEERLRLLGLSGFKRRMPRGNFIAICNILRRRSGGGGPTPSFWWLMAGHMGTTNLHQGRLRLDIRKKLFTVKAILHQNGLPREAPSPTVFKRHLDNILNHIL